MSTFLQLVNTVRQEAGIAGADLTSLQASLSAESARIKSWVQREYLRICADKPHWQFLRRSGVFPTAASQAQYTIAGIGAASTPVFTAAQFGNWKRDSFRFYRDPAFTDEMLAAFMPWDQFRNLYLYGSMRTSTTRPVVFTVAPDKSLYLGITPDAVYTTVYEFYAIANGLSADADAPAFPAEYHDLVVFRALAAYGVFQAAPEVIARASQEINRIYPKLLADQLPIPVGGPPLA